MENLENEIWKNVIGYENKYNVSSLGRVKNIVTGLILKGSINSSGYIDVKLYGSVKPKSISIHVLVAQSFLNYVTNGTKGFVVDHIDSVKTNNILTNLRLISHRENVRKDIKKKTTPYFGVYKNGTYSKKWRARFYYKNKAIHVGYFHCDFQAHLAVESKLKELIKNDK